MSKTSQLNTNAGVILGAGIILLIVWLIAANPYEKNQINLLLGLAVICAGMAPAARWYLFYRRDRPIPFFEAQMLFYGICFGFAGLVTPQRFIGDITVTEDMYSRGLSLTLAAQMAMVLGLKAVRLISPSAANENRYADPVDHNRVMGYALLLYFFAFLFGYLFSKLEASLFSNSTDAIRTFSFVLVVVSMLEWKEITGRWRMFSLVAVIVEVVVYSGIFGGTLVGLLKYGWITILCFTMKKRSIPWLGVLGLLAIYFLLQPVKGDYRAKTWALGFSPTPLESVKIYIDVLAEQGTVDVKSATSSDNIIESYSRINHLHTFSAVIADTPQVSDFRYGETLLPLLSKWIPRIAWPDKPLEDLGNSWGRDYGYLHADDFQTSYNLPWLVEMFMNFGLMGVVIMSFLVGLILGIFDRLNVYAKRNVFYFSACVSIFTTICFPESNISLQIGGAIVVAVTLLVILRLTVRPTEKQIA